ncbi:hypothetical protein DX912_13405 [Lysobacter soli]|uniref:Uncharacterized protein n=1 Tax=Lysobacter soli TaxID=453783 RepID=A0A3D8VBA3_9GAMM|nr:hypothetical protein DX912_13405 [Lysobacter soli]
MFLSPSPACRGGLGRGREAASRRARRWRASTPSQPPPASRGRGRSCLTSSPPAAAAPGRPSR